MESVSSPKLGAPVTGNYGDAQAVGVAVTKVRYAPRAAAGPVRFSTGSQQSQLDFVTSDRAIETQ